MFRNQEFDSCHRFQPIFEGEQQISCSSDNFLTNVSVKCTEYVYEQTQMVRTLTTDLDMVCDKADMKRHFTTVLLIGRAY